MCRKFRFPANELDPTKGSEQFFFNFALAYLKICVAVMLADCCRIGDNQPDLCCSGRFDLLPIDGDPVQGGTCCPLGSLVR